MILLLYLLLIQIRILQNIFLEALFSMCFFRVRIFKKMKCLNCLDINLIHLQLLHLYKHVVRFALMHSIHYSINERTQKIKLHKGYRLLAVDGSVLISSAIKDTKTTFYKANNQPFSAYHLNTSYDLLECTYD